MVRTPLLICSLLACATARAQFHYRVLDLGTFGGTYAVGSGINPSNQVAGGASLPDGLNSNAFLYSDGVLTNLHTLGGDTSAAFAINSLGQAVGYSWLSGNTNYHGFLYDGVLHDLGSLGIWSQAYGINSSTQVVGDSELSNGFIHAFFYFAGTMIDLGTLPDYLESAALAINTSGQIAGYARSSSTYTAFRIDGGTMKAIPPVPGYGYGYSVAESLNDLEEIIGFCGPGNDIYGPAHACILYPTPLDLGALGPDDWSWAEGINTAGLIVGTDQPPSGPNHAFLYASGTMYDLNNLLDPSAAGVLFERANGISDRGYIVGYGTTSGSGGKDDPLLLIPYATDEPTSYSIVRGTLFSGSLASLFSIDTDYLKVLTGPTLNQSEAPVWVVVNGTADFAAPTDLRLVVTAHVNTPGTTQTIELWDFVASAWVNVGSQGATTIDTTQVGIGSTPSRFIQPVTNAVRARVSWKQSGPTLIYRWEALINQVVWNISP